MGSLALPVGLCSRSRAKKAVHCTTSGGRNHLSCIGLTQRQVSDLGAWSCLACRGMNNRSAAGDGLGGQLSLEGYVGACQSMLRVLTRVPKGAVGPVASALTRLIREALEQGTQLEWSRLLSFCYWDLQCPKEDSEERSTSMSTKVQRQVSKFLELTDQPQLPEPVGRPDSVQRDGQDEDRKLNPCL